MKRTKSSDAPWTLKELDDVRADRDRWKSRAEGARIGGINKMRDIFLYHISREPEIEDIINLANYDAEQLKEKKNVDFKNRAALEDEG